MALLATLLAFVAPSLSRSARGRRLTQEAARLLAVTEYARDEAISQGVPMTVWIDVPNGRFGVEAKAGYASDEARQKEFTLDADIHFDQLEQAPTAVGSVVYAIEFAPDGTPETTSVTSIRLIDKTDASVALSLTDDDWGYEILEEGV